MYRNVRGKGRVKTKRYLAWIELAGLSIHGGIGKHCKFPGDVFIHIKIKRPDRRKRDIDNLIKAPLDLLVSCGVINDDRYVEKVTAEWVYDGPDGATIEIEEI